MRLDSGNGSVQEISKVTIDSGVVMEERDRVLARDKSDN
jgi:hypothetical protein